MSGAQPSRGPGGGLTKDDYRTPPGLMARIYADWGLNFDPCPYPREPGYDALLCAWYHDGEGPSRAFVNPPYGKEAARFMEKAVGEIRDGRCEIAVFLVFARTDTKAFHRTVLPYAREIAFIEGRITFVGADGASPYPSMLVVFDKESVGAWDDMDGTERATRIVPVRSYRWRPVA